MIFLLYLLEGVSWPSHLCKPDGFGVRRPQNPCKSSRPAGHYREAGSRPSQVGYESVPLWVPLESVADMRPTRW